MGHSIFMNKEEMPDQQAIIETLGENYGLWNEICNFVLEKYPTGIEE